MIGLYTVSTIYWNMGLESTVGVAKVGTNSVRTTVPEGITEFLGIKAGDKLEWKMEMFENERTAIVRKKSRKISPTELARYSMKRKQKMVDDS